MTVASSVASSVARSAAKSIVAGGSGYDSDAANYFVRAEALGGSFDQSAINATYTAPYVKRAISDFVSGCKADAIWDKLTEAYLLCGVSFGGLMAKLKYSSVATLTNTNFVTGDYVTSGSGAGLVGNGSTKYLSTPKTTDPSSISFGAYITQRASAIQRCIGQNQLTDPKTLLMLFSNSTTIYADVPTDSAAGGSGDCRMQSSQTGGGFSVGSATSLSSRKLFWNGTNVATNTVTAAATVNTNNLEVFRVITAYYDGRLSFAFAGTGLTDTDASNLSLRVNALMTTLGANVY